LQTNRPYGQCQCGAVQYQLNGEPLTYYVCHCRHCQLQSSSAFGLSLWVHSDNFKLTDGQLSHWTETADSGSRKDCAFCGRCGTRIYHGFEGNSSVLTIKTGTLSNLAELKPIAHVWTSRALPWVLPLADNVRCYKQQPDSADELFALWQQSHQ
jgi:hypothetical protein